MPFGYGQMPAKAVPSGKVPESLLDELVRRVLRDKFAFDLFDDPYVPEPGGDAGSRYACGVIEKVE